MSAEATLNASAAHRRQCGEESVPRENRRFACLSEPIKIDVIQYPVDEGRI
jgi:hypothetical protein